MSKVIHSSNQGIVTSNLFYNGNRIVRITESDGWETKYYYTGDLITKTENYNNNILVSERKYQYDGQGNPISCINLSYNTNLGSSTKLILIYNADGSLTYNLYGGNLVSQNNNISQSNANLTNGEITSFHEVDAIYPYIAPSDKTYVITYDNKNTPYKNILGFEKIAIIDSRPGGFQGVKHNFIKESTTDNITGNTYISKTTNTQYNSNNFPNNVENKEYAANGSLLYTLSYQCFYE